MDAPIRQGSQAVLQSTGESAHAECLFCGKLNPIGFKLDFQAQEDGSVRAEFASARPLQSYPGTLHGGVVAALLDSAMTNCLFSRGVVAVTAELTVRFLEPVSVVRALDLSATVARSRRRVHYVCARLTQDGVLAARAEAKFVERDGAARPVEPAAGATPRTR